MSAEQRAYAPEEAKRNFVVLDSDEQHKKHELLLQKFRPERDSDRALAIINRLSGTNKENLEKIADESRRKEFQAIDRLIESVASQLQDKVSGGGVRDYSLADLQGKLVEIFLNYHGMDAEQQIQKISNHVQAVFRSKFPQLKDKLTGQVGGWEDGVLTEVKYLRDRNKEKLQPKLIREYFSNGELDAKYKIDNIKAVYHIEGSQIIVNELELAQVKSQVNPLKFKEIHKAHADFLHDFVLAVKTELAKTPQLDPEQAELNLERPEMKEEVAYVTNHLETIYLNFLDEKMNEEEFIKSVSEFLKNYSGEAFSMLSPKAKSDFAEQSLIYIKEDIASQAGTEKLGKKLEQIQEDFKSHLKRTKDKPHYNTQALEIKKITSVVWSPAGEDTEEYPEISVSL